MKASVIPPTIDPSNWGRPASGDLASPFRYPGGKMLLTGFFEALIESLGNIRTFVEPYCGGAGAALMLLRRGCVEHLCLNDADDRVYSAWRAMIEETDRFVERLSFVSLDLPEWKKQQAILKSHRGGYSFEVGFAAFYINRTSRAGILDGSGPIGGTSQSGKWTLDVRFYRETMVKRISWLGEQRQHISLSNEDGIECITRLRSQLEKQNTLFFIDPPYVSAGPRLYLNAMDAGDHENLSHVLGKMREWHWTLTYDDCPLVRQCYSDSPGFELGIRYSLARKRKASELMFASPSVGSMIQEQIASAKSATHSVT